MKKRINKSITKGFACLMIVSLASSSIGVNAKYDTNTSDKILKTAIDKRISASKFNVTEVSKISKLKKSKDSKIKKTKKTKVKREELKEKVSKEIKELKKIKNKKEKRTKAKEVIADFKDSIIYNDLDVSEDVILNSVTDGSNSFLYIKTDETRESISELLANLDENIEIIKDFDFGTKKYFKLKLSSDSVVKNELLDGLNTGSIPDNLFGYEVIPPLFVNTTDNSDYISGEYLSYLWGITSTKSDLYQEELSSKESITVGVIDTGINYNHEDLVSNIYTNSNEIAGNGLDDDNNGYIDDVKGYDFVNDDNDAMDDHFHGTHVAGTIGGAVNSKGVFGVNSNSSLIPLKVLDSAGSGGSYDIADAIKYAADNGIKVINMSLGGSGDPTNSIMCDAIDYAKSKGTITVVAAGNDDSDMSSYVPAACDNAITVAAVDDTITRAIFSNYGDGVDIAAPGVDILSSYFASNNQYAYANGTSMAAPHVAGLVSAMLSYDETLTTSEIKNIFKDTNYSDSVNTESNKFIGRFMNTQKVLEYLKSLSTEEPIGDALEAENMYGFLGEIVDDVNANGGKAIKATVGTEGAGTMQFGPYVTDLEAGTAYTANFRLKVSNNSSLEKIAMIDVYDYSTGLREYREIRASDFSENDTYQNFGINFIKPVSNNIEYRIFYYDKQDLWSDKVLLEVNDDTTTLPDYESENLANIVGKVIVDNDASGNLALEALVSDTDEGTIQFGPYDATNLVDGETYKATFTLKVKDNTFEKGIGVIDVYNGDLDYRELLEIKGTDFTSNDTYTDITINFVKTAGSKNYEYRLFFYDKQDITIDKVTITK